MPTDSGYSKIIAFDFSNDGKNDLLLYGHNKNRYTVHTSNDKNTFSRPVDKFFFHQITEIKKLNNRLNQPPVFVFSSRSERLVGLVSFTKFGSFRLLNKINFDSYPSSISIGDIDANGKNEALVCGNSFNGISILRERDLILREKKIFEGRIFSNAVFIDLDFDGILDIAAHDLQNNSIVFINSILGEFQETRELSFESPITNLTRIDFNSDGFNDLVFSHSDGLQVIFGDSVSSFTQTEFYELNNDPSAFAIADFNYDSHNDIAFITKDNSRLNISFSINENMFNNPVVYGADTAFVFITTFKTESGRNLLTLSENGLIRILKRQEQISDSLQIKVSPLPQKLAAFDLNRDKTTDIAFIDEQTRTLNLLISGKLKIFRYLFTIGVSELPGEILIAHDQSEGLYAYCYTKGKRLIEVYHFDLYEFNIVKEKIYSDFPIISLKQFVVNSNLTMSVLTKSEKGFELINFGLDDSKNYIKLGIIDLPENVVDSRFNTGVYEQFIWTLNPDNIELKSLNFSKDELPFFETKHVSMPFTDFNRLEFINKAENPSGTIATLIERQKTNIHFYKANTNINFTLSFDDINNDDCCTDDFQFTFNNKGNPRSIYYLDRVTERINRYKVGKFKIDENINLIESKEINDYFVSRLFGNDEYLVYSSSASRSIILKKINE
ncbi:MAG: VCBS repeat-containing protein [Melioribacteraceae bacterium]|nr:VCBS repeat-containing protein [Melioribacteraceae bacterium]MCF8353822.1 VCBS repeat-containing protein [Melioribacteraceae bacterium]MCF8393658.1 VCBS repeat-containing protein [Melioribacteraceae bacterium]MCF8419468.1 VCBS repeat-containing protein [Melioribacteraceae bacterium]